MGKRWTTTLVFAAGLTLAAPQFAAADPEPATISGTFTNDCSDGSAWIELLDATGTKVDSVSVASGADFTFSLVAPGDYSVVPFAPAGCGVMPFPDGAPVSVGADGVADVDVRLVPVHSVSGTVTGCAAGAGEGINGVPVALEIDTDDLTYQATTTTAAFTEDGQFFFSYLPAYSGYLVTVSPPPGCTIEDSAVAVDLAAGDVEVDFALSRSPVPAGSLASLGLEHLSGSLGSLVGAGS